MLTLTCEDNMHMMHRYPDKSFNLAIPDPGYNNLRFKKGFGYSRFKHFKCTNGLRWNVKGKQDYWDELFRVSKNQIIWGGNNFSLPPSEYFCVWNKQQPLDNYATLEYAWVSMGLRKPAKMFTYPVQKAKHTVKIHVMQKPVALYEWILQTYAKPGDTILDTHLGSASIAIACHNLGFDLTACENDEAMFNKSQARINAHVKQKNMYV